MRERICKKCRFYDENDIGWQNKCLMCKDSYMIEHIKSNVLPYNKCDYFKEINK